jgi:UDP-glucose 6-dehydrogenase
VHDIGNSNPVYLMRCIEILDEYLPKKAGLEMLPMQPGEVPATVADVSRLEHAVGYHPQVILAGRRINDGTGKYVAEQTLRQVIQDGDSIKDVKVNVFGLAFKENSPDLRNSCVVDAVEELRSFGIQVFAYDPVVSANEAKH